MLPEIILGILADALKLALIITEDQPKEMRQKFWADWWAFIQKVFPPPGAPQ